MARLTPKQQEEMLKKQNRLYGGGEDQLGGSATEPEEDDDAGEAVKDVIGNEPEPGKPFSFEKEVEEDEKARRGYPSTIPEEEEE